MIVMPWAYFSIESAFPQHYSKQKELFLCYASTMNGLFWNVFFSSVLAPVI